jgi:peptidoglycan/LPS O-acetylase OafA/YrhL
MRDESAFSGQPTDQGATGPVVEGPARDSSRRIPLLDGWRATSILLVLGAHLLPLGPHHLQLNEAAAAAGMALFFTLSGFLIVQFLAGGMRIPDFLARRVARILPLSWAAVTILVIAGSYDPVTIARNYFFVANLPPASLLNGGEHLWSLGVEMQFYVSIALICSLFGRRGLFLVPVLCVGVTCARMAAGQTISIVTWHRVDEILAGGVIALVYSAWLGGRARRLMLNAPFWPFVVGFLICSHPASGPLQYLRPYLAALMVGVSLGHVPEPVRRLLVSRPMAYIAEISYALYVIHGMLVATWLGSGSHLAKYLKRPLLVGATFLLAHLSTRKFEQPITRAVRNWSRARSERTAISPPQLAAASRPCE